MVIKHILMIKSRVKISFQTIQESHNLRFFGYCLDKRLIFFLYGILLVKDLFAFQSPRLVTANSELE